MTFKDDNGNTIEGKGTFAMTKQTVSFFKFQIKGDVSINFNVDKNSENCKTLGYYGPQMNSQVAWTKQVFNRLDEDGNTLDRGYIVIQDEEGRNLDCFYVSGNSNWVQLLNGLITELDYSGVTNGIDYTTKLDVVTMLTLTNSTTGICLPFADWGYNLKKGFNSRYGFWGDNLTFVDSRNDRENYPVLDIYPCFFLSSLITEICKQNGLKIAGTLVSDPLYKSLAITPINGLISRKQYNSCSTSGSNQVIPGGGASYYTSLTATNDPDLLFNSATGTYTANRRCCVIITTTFVARSNAFIYWVELWKNNSFFFVMCYWNTSDNARSTPVSVSVGDTLRVKIYNGDVNPYTATINLKFEIATKISAGDYVTPDMFLPPLPSIDILKYAFFTFGCNVSFDEFSKTITANKIEDYKKEDALDFSEYYLSHKPIYTLDTAKNNYIEQGANQSDLDVIKYNTTHKVKYGDGNLETGNTLKNETTLYQSPFSASYFGNYRRFAVNSGDELWQSNIPLINLIDTTDVIAAAKTNIALGQSRFTFTTNTTFFIYEIIRVTNSNGTDMGYFNIDVSVTSTYIELNFPDTSDNTVYIRRQSINYNTIEPRIIVVKEGVPVSAITNNSPFLYFINSDVTTLQYGFFSKKETSRPIDNYLGNCAWDNPDTGEFKDSTIKEIYLNKIGRIINNPRIVVRMMLPMAAFSSFDFSKLIFIKTEGLTGYFFVESIVNYVDGTTPVEINLYML